MWRRKYPHNKKFKILRPALIQEAIHQRNSTMLKCFFDETAEDNGELVSYRGRSMEELLLAVEEEIAPSILLSVLLSSEDEEDHAKAVEIYQTLRDEDKLEAFENRGEEKDEEVESIDNERQVNLLQDELKQGLQKNVKLEGSLKNWSKGLKS